MAELSPSFPPGIEGASTRSTPRPSSSSRSARSSRRWSRRSCLVFLVMFLFLQNWRATLIPTIAVPVVLLGTFGVLAAVGYSINTLTMFAHGAGDRPAGRRRDRRGRERRADDARGGPVAAGGDAQVDGRDHRRAGRHRAWCCRRCSCRWPSSAARPASSTASSRSPSSRPMVLSVLVALILTPALCATLLKPPPKARPRARARLLRLVQPQLRPRRRTATQAASRGSAAAGRCAGRLRRDRRASWRCCSCACRPASCRTRTRASHVRSGHAAARRDRRAAPLAVLRAGRALLPRRREGQRRRRCSPSPASASSAPARTPASAFVDAQGLGRAPGREPTRAAGDRRPRDRRAVAQVRDAPGLRARAAGGPGARQSRPASTSSCEDVGGIGHDALLAARNQLLGMAAPGPGAGAGAARTAWTTRRSSSSTSTRPRPARSACRRPTSTTTLSARRWGGAYVNDFIDRGRVKRVFVQADAPFRTQPEDLDDLVRARHRRARWCRSRRSRRRAGRYGADAARALQRPAVDARSRARRRPASSSGDGDGRDGDAGQPSCRPASATSGPACRYEERLSGGAGAGALRALAAGRLPVPGRALRELVDPVRGAAGGAARRRRRGARRDAARPRQRRLLPGRPAHHDRPVGRRTRS